MVSCVATVCLMYGNEFSSGSVVGSLLWPVCCSFLRIRGGGGGGVSLAETVKTDVGPTPLVREWGGN